MGAPPFPPSMSQSLSDTDICNAALVEIGAKTITALSDTSTEGQACAAKYFIARDAALRSHPWNFARKWQALNQLATAPLALLIKPDPHFQSSIIFTGAYQLPPDCIRVFRAAPFNYNFRIVGTQLYTDAPAQALTSGSFTGAQPGVGLPPANNTTNPNQVGIEYVSRTTDPTQFDSMFVDALVAKVAAELAWTLTANQGLRDSKLKEYEAKLMEAWYADGAENWQDELYNNVLTDVRNIYGAPDGSIPY